MADETFTCIVCGKDKPVHKHGGTGYAIGEYSGNGKTEKGRICYLCVGDLDEKELRKPETTEYGMYLAFTNAPTTQWFVRNWPGTYSLPARVKTTKQKDGRVLYSVTFTGPDGRVWRGRNYSGSGCHVRVTCREVTP